jgi:hypothetical protein
MASQQRYNLSGSLPVCGGPCNFIHGEKTETPHTSHSSLFPGTDVDLMVKEITRHAFQNGEQSLFTSVREISVFGMTHIKYPN